MTTTLFPFCGRVKVPSGGDGFCIKNLHYGMKHIFKVQSGRSFAVNSLRI